MFILRTDVSISNCSFYALPFIFSTLKLLVTYKLVLDWVYKILSCQYLINICKFQGLMYTGYANKKYLQYIPTCLI